MSRNNRWIVRRTPREDASVRLFCLPHAGAGSVIFREWHTDLPPHIDVCAIEPPGRFARRHEPAPRELSQFVHALDSALEGWLDLPFAFFGYSLGALMAFECARSIRRTRGIEPKQLMFAAAKAPQRPPRLSAISHASREVFVGELERRYGPFEPVIKSDAEMFELVLQIMRTDVSMLEAYRYRDEPAFDCPITAFGGSSDPSVLPEELAAWRTHTRGPFASHLFPGGHFFLRNSGKQLRSLVGQQLCDRAVPAASVQP